MSLTTSPGYPTPKLQFLLYFREHCVYPNSNSRTYLSTSTNKAQCETKYISSAIVVPTAIFTGHSCNHFFGNNKAASNEATSQMHHSIYETTTASPLLDMRIREPWFSTIYNWRTRSVDSVLRTTMYIPTSQRNVPEQTLISQTLLVHMVSSNQDKWKNVLVLGTAYKKQDCCFWTKNVKRCSSK